MIVRYNQVSKTQWDVKYYPVCCKELKREISKIGKYVVIDAKKKEFKFMSRNGDSDVLTQCPFCGEEITFLKNDESYEAEVASIAPGVTINSDIENIIEKIMDEDSTSDIEIGDDVIEDPSATV